MKFISKADYSLHSIEIHFPIFRKARSSSFRVLENMTVVLNVANLKYGKYDITSEKININKRLSDRAET